MTDDTSTHTAAGPRLDGWVRALREGEVMGAYIDFDRTADHAWTPAEYLVRFGQYVSQRTPAQRGPAILSTRLSLVTPASD